MKKNIITVILLATLSLAYGQNNTFPATGNVGVGTLTPSAEQEIYQASGGGNMLRLNTGFTGGNRIDINPFIYGVSNGGFEIKQNDVQRFVINIVGNVGIGTTAPISKLTVAGDIAYGEAFSNTLFRDDAGAFGANVRSGFYQTSNPINYPTGASGWWHLLDVRHSNANNNYAMQFSGYFEDQELWFRKTGNNASQPWRKVLMEQTNGNVGIGTAAPQAKLDINSNASSTYESKLQLSDTGSVANSSTGIDWRNAQYNWDQARISIERKGQANSFSLMFHTSKDGLLSEKLRIDEIGNVGIGTTNPLTKLDVKKDLNTNDYLNVAQHRSQFQIGRQSDAKSLEFAVLDNGTSIIQSKEAGVGYNSLILNPANDGNVGIGTINPQAKLDVAGKSSFSDNMKITANLEAKEIKVTTTPTADFVFAEDYQLPKLEAVEKHIKEKKHLPEIASAKEMEKEGVNVGEFQIKLLQKIEELTLYTIEQNKQIKIQSEKIEKLEKLLNK